MGLWRCLASWEWTAAQGKREARARQAPNRGRHSSGQPPTLISTSIQANGNNDVHWLKVLVSPRTREVFAYQPQIVPANRTAVPVP